MATDVKESDTEDHERPAPAKRQCMKIVNSHDEMSHQTVQDSKGSDTAPETEYELTEKLIREQLRRWQACQVAKGFVDNTINRVMENYILGPQADASQFRLFRGTDMEDTAVMMAIRNHGLVHSGQLEDEGNDIYQSFSNSLERDESKNFGIPLAATSSKTSPSGVDNCQENMRDKIDDGGDEQDFLERAVAEAIKIKGLSALSVDYG
ncbi:uncharacterized protein [Fopius arisanus]|uniref:Uncharacterized protein n=1 Tax=Fopius arisanus TaxID=64838 RepID=A0A9R1T059_9HYME|nr:PREDICTED: uncharacterized protein LOC105264850 [Fopius arisanus]XP_011300307.1 PREDICTED: uncharacterized protein LOC105264850 [Fopius arisanus]